MQMRWVMGYLVALCLLMLIFAQSIIIPTFFMPFFRWQYDRLDVANTIQVSDEELMSVTVELLDYMRPRLFGQRRDTLDGITAIVAGYEREFFSDIEKRHMIDVRELYDILFMVRNIAFFLLAALIMGMLLLKYRVLYVLARCSRDILAGFLILSAVLVGIIAFDFDRAFIIFHHIFFDNDYWILDPRVDLLINMVPIYFFIHISIFIAGILVITPLVIILISSLYLRNAVLLGYDRT